MRRGRAQDRLDLFPENFYGPLGSIERRKRLQRHSNLQRIYGISLKTYETLHDAQNGLCAICREPEIGVHNRGNQTVPLSLAVDHDHKTGTVRGLLCHKCNKALGLFDDKPALVEAALDYLRSHQQED